MRVSQIGAEAARWVLDGLYPPVCVACGEPIADPRGLCAACWRDAAFIAGPVCDRCGTPLDGASATGETVLCSACDAAPKRWDRGRAATIYGGAARTMAIGLKRADRTDLARPMAAWMARAAAALAGSVDVVIPVPLHWRRRAARRFNQSAELARGVARGLEKPLDLNALLRPNPTPSQDGKNRFERSANVADAFTVSKGGRKRLAGQRVLIVDDVLTTGATVAACAAALRDAGAAETHIVVFALAPPPERASISGV